jgi:hypothetical protein
MKIDDLLRLDSNPSGHVHRARRLRKHGLVRPPRHWKCIGIRTTSVVPSSRTCPGKSVSIATLNTIAPGGWRGRVAQVHLDALCKIERLGEEQRAVGTATNFSRGARC